MVLNSNSKSNLEPNQTSILKYFNNSIPWAVKKSTKKRKPRSNLRSKPATRLVVSEKPQQEVSASKVQALKDCLNNSELVKKVNFKIADHKKRGRSSDSSTPTKSPNTREKRNLKILGQLQ